MARRTFTRLGQDLALTPYRGTASAAPLTAADSWGALDLRVGGPQNGDLMVVTARENLAQALTLRLLTEKGALTPLGHPNYGSRLVSLIGRRNNETTRNLARLYVIEAVKQEARVRELTALRVETAPGDAGTLLIGMTVLPLGDDDPLPLEVELSL